MNVNIFLLAASVTFMIIGAIGKPSRLNEPPNTATLIYLTGWILLGLYLNTFTR